MLLAPRVYSNLLKKTRSILTHFNWNISCTAQTWKISQMAQILSTNCIDVILEVKTQKNLSF